MRLLRNTNEFYIIYDLLLIPVLKSFHKDLLATCNLILQYGDNHIILLANDEYLQRVSRIWSSY
jgi:hypothetical protein